MNTQRRSHVMPAAMPVRLRSSLAHAATGIAMVLTCSATVCIAQAPARSPTTSKTAPVQGRWSDPARSPDDRARAVLAAMTLDEELSLLTTSFPLIAQMRGGVDKKLPAGVPMSAGYLRGIPRLGLPAVAETDASLGVSNTGDMRKGDVATALPAAVALGASFDPDLAYRGGAMIGAEARGKGFGVMLAGGVNLIREPRGGRAFEYVSEDPLLSGMLGGRSIAGIQSNNIVSTVKHLALNATETGRFVYNVDMPEDGMRESDLLAFQIANEVGRPGSVMCAYNKINTVYACENSFLLTDVLRRDWGFTGFVMSDWGAVHSTGALVAGLDQESGYEADTRPFFAADLKSALVSGTVSKTAVDRAALRILRTLFAHGVYDRPPVQGGPIDYDAHAAIAQAQAEAGIVLLKNASDVLPLAASARRIAVIGGHADAGVLFGGGSAQVVPVGGVKLLIRPKTTNPSMFGVRTYGGTPPLAAIKARFPKAVIEFADGSDVAAAATLARSADAAIVFGEKWASEGEDHTDLSLGDGQDDLITAIVRANKKTIVVLETGNPVLMPWRDDAAAILEAWYPGQRGGEAIARVLAGDVNPSGRLPVTFPASAEQIPNPVLPGVGVPEVTRVLGGGLPTIVEKAPFTYRFPEGSDVGYRWYAKRGLQPLFAFGHGLSYTNFAMDGLAVRGDKATFTIRNTGSRAGATVGQVYLVERNGEASRRLVAFQRVFLNPGEERRLTATIDARLLADWKDGGWRVRAGTYVFALGDNAMTLHVPVRVRRTDRSWTG